MLQELCRDSFFKACKAVSGAEVKLKGRSSPFVDFYGKSGMMLHKWNRLPIAKLKGQRGSESYQTRIKAWHYFNENADKLRNRYIAVTFGYDLTQGMKDSGTFDALFEGFYSDFEERKDRFMEQTNKALDANIAALAAKGKHPQSHGGVANLLKVLTKTMHDQGASIYTVAKVQYAICMQAGIYIPDEFLTDVLVAHEMLSEG